jgi:hypothetical protein
MTGISPRASVSDTSVWQLAVLPKHTAGHPPNGPLLIASSIKHGIVPPTIYRLTQFCLYRRRIPDPGGNEVVQLIIFAKRKPLRHRLNALAIARADQPRYVKRAHLAPRFMTQPIQKRLEPTSKLFSPIRCFANHGRPLQKPTTHESQKN